MPITNQFERDVVNQAQLKHPGRVDMIVLQNTADAGDGFPGIQRCFRNYLHEGGMEKDLDLNSYDIKNVIDISLNGEIIFPTATIHSVGTHIHIHPNTGNADGEVHLHPLGTNTASFINLRNSGTANYGAIEFRISGSVVSFDPIIGGGGSYPDTFNINNAEIDNINIGDAGAVITLNAVGISATQFGYLGELDQPLKQADSPTFASPIVTNLNLTDDIIHVGNTDNLISFGIDTQTFQVDGGTELDISNNGVRIGGANVRVTGIINDDSLGTSDVVLCTQGNVKAYVDNKLPIGFIAMYSGSWTDNSTIPGWYKCDGNNGTVNLVDKFVRGGTTSGATGGSDDAVVVQHNHTASSTTDGVHQHVVPVIGIGSTTTIIDASPSAGQQQAPILTTEDPGHTHPITVDNEGVSATDENIPAYYTLIFIQRIS